MKNSITIPNREYEELVRASEQMRIITEAARFDKYIPDTLIRMICGLQAEREAEDKASIRGLFGESPEPAIMIEDIEDPPEVLHPETCATSHMVPCPPPPEYDDPHIVIPDSVPHSEPTPNPPPAKKKKSIDKGRVKALHDADWTMTKIADEMGCSVQRISQIIKEEM